MIKYSKEKSQLEIGTRCDDLHSIVRLTQYMHTKEGKAGNCFTESVHNYLRRLEVSVEALPIPYKLDSRIVDLEIPFPPVKDPLFTFIDLFAGIGGFRLAFQGVGGKCVFSSEWNHFSRKTYEANFGEVPFGDITKISSENIPDHDVLVAGFPCQPFSLAGVSKKNALGRQHGFQDLTQGTLFFEIARIIKAKMPKAILLENVKNLLSHDSGRTFEIITGTLSDLGYNVHSALLDGKHFRPQHRERIIIAGFLRSDSAEEDNFRFPVMPPPVHRLSDILEESPDNKYTISDKLWSYLKMYADKHRAKGNGFGYGLADLNGITRTLSARYYKDGAEILIPQEGKNPRKLTPRECARLQGYPDNFIIPVSDNQAYRQFGNSVVVPLMKSVAEQIVSELNRRQLISIECDAECHA